MAVEIERKYLVHDASWKDAVQDSKPIRQGYLETRESTVRVRVKGECAFLTIKGPSKGVSRSEFEYEIPVEDANEMLDTLCIGRELRKTRHTLMVGEHEWVVDEFEGRHDGLVMAEIELESEDESFVMPAWAGEDVSEDSRYYNANLVRQ